MVERSWGLLLTTPTNLARRAGEGGSPARSRPTPTPILEHEQAMRRPDAACPPVQADASAGVTVAYVILTSPFERPHGRRQGPIQDSSVLQMHLLALAELRALLVRRLMIMVPSDPTRRLARGYLEVSAEIERLPFPTTVERVLNNSLGSYGMYFEAFARTRPTDRYISGD